MILSVSLVYVSDQPVLMCRVGTSKQTQMSNLEQAFQSYEKQRIPGARLVLLHAVDHKDAVKATLRFDLIRRFGTVAVYRHEEHGFRVIATRTGSTYRMYDVIHREKLVAHPTNGGQRK